LLFFNADTCIKGFIGCFHHLTKTPVHRDFGVTGKSNCQKFVEYYPNFTLLRMSLTPGKRESYSKSCKKK